MMKHRMSLRQQKILDLLSAGNEISVAKLAGQFSVTTMTVRRDLDALEKDRRITRTYGGAILAAPSIVSFAFGARQQTQMKAKQAIARKAAEFVEPGMTVILDTGTTTLEVAGQLSGIRDLKVLTSSLAIASALLAHDGLELVLLGGTVNSSSPDLSGPLTEENLLGFRADVAFVGADAVDRAGLYTNTQEIARVSRAMITSARQTILVADSSKFGNTAFVRFAGWKDVDAVVTDRGLASTQRRWLKQSVNDITTVSVQTE